MGKAKEEAGFSEKRKNYIYNKMVEALKNLSNGYYKGKVFETEGFGTKDYNIALDIVLDETRRNAIFISDEVDNSLKRKRGTNMNIFYDEKLAKEMDEEARLQAIFDRALTDPESLNEVSDEDLEKLMPYMDRLILKLEEEFEILKEQSQKLLAELDEYIKMAEAEEMKMLAEMKEE